MHRLSSPGRPLRSFMASTHQPRWCPPAVTRRAFSLMVDPNQPARSYFGSPHESRNMASSNGIKGEELGKPSIAYYANGRPSHTAQDESRASVNVISGDGVPRCPIDEDVYPMEILPTSSHRDGSIYEDTHRWKRTYHIADRNETILEAMMFSNPTDCVIRDGACRHHSTCHMLQIFSLKLAKLPVECGSVELYGYIAVRDKLDPLLNYIINFSRSDPIIVKQGSLINMSGPKRGIELIGTILIEYDMRIKTGEQEKDDLQLIDGVSIIDDIDTQNCRPFTERILGDCGAIDITGSLLHFAVEATVEVIISEVQGSFNMRLGCFTSGVDEEIWLFDGSVGESCGLKRSVVAVVMGKRMDLKFKLGTGSLFPAEFCFSFEANKHGHAAKEMKTDFALISVKVTWSTLPDGV